MHFLGKSIYNFRVFLKDRNSCVSDLWIFICVPSKLLNMPSNLSSHSLISKFCYWKKKKKFLLTSLLTCIILFFLGISEGGLEGRCSTISEMESQPPGIKWRRASLFGSLFHIEWDITQMVLATSQTGYCSSPSGRCWRGISRMVFFLPLFLFYILCLSPLLNCFFGRASPT